MILPKIETVLNAVTATTTSDAINLQNVKRCTLEFTRANHSAGSSAFTVTVSVDGVNYYAYNKLIDNVTNTNSQTLTRVSGKTLSSNTTALVSMDLEHDTFHSMKVTVTETTDGTHTAKIIRSFS